MWIKVKIKFFFFYLSFHNFSLFLDFVIFVIFPIKSSKFSYFSFFWKQNNMAIIFDTWYLIFDIWYKTNLFFYQFCFVILRQINSVIIKYTFCFVNHLHHVTLNNCSVSDEYRLVYVLVLTEWYSFNPVAFVHFSL